MYRDTLLDPPRDQRLEQIRCRHWSLSRGGMYRGTSKHVWGSTHAISIESTMLIQPPSTSLALRTRLPLQHKISRDLLEISVVTISPRGRPVCCRLTRFSEFCQGTASVTNQLLKDPLGDGLCPSSMVDADLWMKALSLLLIKLILDSTVLQAAISDVNTYKQTDYLVIVTVAQDSDCAVSGLLSVPGSQAISRSAPCGHVYL